MNDNQVKQNRIGRYELQQTFVEGGFSASIVGHASRIYRAAVVSREGAPPEMPNQVALKVFSPSRPLSANQLEYFKQEAVTAKLLTHPRFISFYESGVYELNGQAIHFHAMELGGVNLSQFVNARVNRGQPLSTEEALTFAVQIAEAIDFAHEKGVVLRDLKPSNMILSHGDAGQLKLIDFENALVKGGPGAGDRVGTTMFSAPEHSPNPRLFGQGRAIPASDIYSFAKVIFLLLTGDYPRGIEGQPIVQLPASFDNQPWCDEVCQILHKATRFDPSLRYQSAADLMVDLRKAFTIYKTAQVVADAAVPQWTHRARRRFVRRLVASTAIVTILALISTLGLAIRNRVAVPFNAKQRSPCAPPKGFVDLKVIAQKNLNLRAKPSLRARSHCVLSAGTSAILLGEASDNWIKIRVEKPTQNSSFNCKSLMEGYVYAEHLAIDCQ